MVYVKILRGSFILTGIALVIAFWYGNWHAVELCAILGILEVSLSFDNAVINATVLERMNGFWQKVFLTVGIIIAVGFMRVLLPVLVIWITAGLNPYDAFYLSFHPPADGALTFADGSPSYQLLLEEASPVIKAFGGVFLLTLFLKYILEDREVKWLVWLERPLARIGKLDDLAVIITLGVIFAAGMFLATDSKAVLFAGLLGLLSYLTVNGLGSYFENSNPTEDGENTELAEAGIHGDATDVAESIDRNLKAAGVSTLAKATGRAAFFLFIYLEVMDASFSFDGVIGAFAITSDPVLIALGLGLIGASFVRSLTVGLVRGNALGKFTYLEHGAHWAIGVLALIMILGIRFAIPDYVTGLTGVLFISAAFLHSIISNRMKARRLDAIRSAETQPVVIHPSIRRDLRSAREK